MVHAIFVAAGKGLRMQQDVKKQFLLLKEHTILGHTLKVFGSQGIVDSLTVVVPWADIAYCKDEIITPLQLGVPVNTVAGADVRQGSVYCGITSLDARPEDLVLIHDAVRPFAPLEKVRECLEEARRTGACILGIPASDTLKGVDEKNIITGTIQRKNIWLAQTPQVFEYSLIKRAHLEARADSFHGTDDASLIERIGGSVSIVHGSRYNIKITTPEDLELARILLGELPQSL